MRFQGSPRYDHHLASKLLLSPLLYTKDDERKFCTQAVAALPKGAVFDEDTIEHKMANRERGIYPIHPNCNAEVKSCVRNYKRQSPATVQVHDKLSTLVGAIR